MSTISIIPTEDCICIESRIPVNKAFVNKIDNPQNADKINAHLKDMHCGHKMVEDENATPISVLFMTTSDSMPEEKFNTLLKVMKANHDSFIENVHLRMKEVIGFEKENVDEKKNNEEDKKLQAATKMLKTIEEVNDEDPIVFGTSVAIFLDPIGQVKAGFLKEVLDAYIDKQIANENNK